MTKEEYNAYKRANYKKNSAPHIERVMKYKQENKDKVSEANAAYREKHRKELVQKNSEYQKANRDKINEARRALYARKKAEAVAVAKAAKESVKPKK